MKNIKKLAIITPGRLPVPAVKGGAVEQLITYIIDDNELMHKYDIDLYTLDDINIDKKKYNKTNFIFIKNKVLKRCITKISNTICFLLNISKIRNCYAINVRKYMNKLKDKYDIILIENNILVYDELYRKYNKFKNSNIYFHMHNVIYEDKELKYIFKEISESCKVLIPVSKYIGDYFNSILVVNKRNILYNCIDFNVYDYKLNEIDFKSRFHLFNSSYTYIFTGRCVFDKGIIELINSFIKLSIKYNDISLIVCGINLNNPNDFEKSIIKKTNNNNRIKLFNYTSKENMARLISTSDCVVIPSKCEEAFGVVALEAMAMKKAIISTNAGGLIEPLNSECAIIIDRDFLEENLYNSMEKLYNDRELSNKLALNAYKRVKEVKEFDKENYFNNLIKIIDK